MYEGLELQINELNGNNQEVRISNSFNFIYLVIRQDWKNDTHKQSVDKFHYTVF